MLPGSSERFIPVAEGHAGARETMEYMAVMITRSDPAVDAFCFRILNSPELASLSPLGLAETIFEWVRHHIHYTPDYNDRIIIEEIRTPGYLLTEIERFGSTLGDCDDYVVLLGSLYLRCGFGVVMRAISRHPDRQLEHIYLIVQTDEGDVVADGIVHEPFGWEVPAHEITNMLDMPVLPAIGLDYGPTLYA